MSTSLVGAQAPTTPGGIEVNYTEKLAAFFNPDGSLKDFRYGVLHGGRGSGKSWFVARHLLIKGISQSVRVLCTRELQKSIRDSVHRVLSDQIVKLRLEQFYDVKRDSIVSKINGTEFIFLGLRSNPVEIKGLEGITDCWVEEAQKVSKVSWKYLGPTIFRNRGSRIWVVFNPELENDYTYQRFVKRPVLDSIVVQLNWRDNPWLEPGMLAEMEEEKREDYDAYLNIWEGHCKLTLEGAVYAKELRAAREQKRITRVPYDPAVGVHVFFDLGWADQTVLWFAQLIGGEKHFIDFYQNHQESINFYLKLLQSKRYVYDTLWLPHDARAKELGSGKSTEEIVRSAGFKVRIVPMLSVEDGINAARTGFSNSWFDEDKCGEGIACLGRYRYGVDENTGARSRNPIHDESSDAADAFRYAQIGLRSPRKYSSHSLLSQGREAVEVLLSKFTPETVGPTSPTDWMRF